MPLKFLSKLLGLLYLFGLIGCAHVAANYPGEKPAPKSWVKADEPARWSDSTYTIEVGERKLLEKMLARRNKQLQATARGIGEAGVSRLMAQLKKKNPFIFRLYEESEEFFFYKGTIVFHEKKEIKIKEAQFQLVFVVGQDTLTSKDEGIIFIRHSNPNLSQYSNDGAVLYSSKFNGEPLGHHNRIYIRSSTNGRLISISPVD